VTIAEVARHAGVSTAVVSRLVNNDQALSIRDETRSRVLAAIEDLGYQPNATARSLRRSRMDAFGLIIPNFDNPVYAEIIQGAEATAVGMNCVLLTGSSAGSGLTPMQYARQLASGRVDGLLLADTDASTEAGAGASAVPGSALEPLSVPFLLVNRRVPGVSRYIVLDDERAADMAVSHLVGLGHTQIAHIAGPPSADTARRRAAGYHAAMHAAGLATPPDLVVSADYTPAGGFGAMSELLALRHPPTAVFVANVTSAAGALHSAAARGARIPGDVSVITVHDLSLAAFLSPALTTVRMPLTGLGARALELLAEVPAGDPILETFDGPMELVIRDSTAPPPGRARGTPLPRPAKFPTPPRPGNRSTGER
jgi:LacI family transcriptional regulator